MKFSMAILQSFSLIVLVIMSLVSAAAVLFLLIGFSFSVGAPGSSPLFWLGIIAAFIVSVGLPFIGWILYSRQQYFLVLVIVLVYAILAVAVRFLIFKHA